MANFLELAVEAVAAHLEEQLPQALRDCEDANGLDSMSLADPKEVVRAMIDKDNRAPLIGVYETSWEWSDQRNNLVFVQIDILMQVIGDARIVEGKNKLRRYLESICKVIREDNKLGRIGDILATRLTTGDADVITGDASETKHQGVQTVIVHVKGAA
jgi:hypothetical protein